MPLRTCRSVAHVPRSPSTTSAPWEAPASLPLQRDWDPSPSAGGLAVENISEKRRDTVS
jgi:hypothetical protein